MPYGVFTLNAAFSRENWSAEALIAASSSVVQSRKVISSRGTKNT
jgi:hypothetical protein